MCESFLRCISLFRGYSICFRRIFDLSNHYAVWIQLDRVFHFSVSWTSSCGASFRSFSCKVSDVLIPISREFSPRFWKGFCLGYLPTR